MESARYARYFGAQCFDRHLRLHLRYSKSISLSAQGVDFFNFSEEAGLHVLSSKVVPGTLDVRSGGGEEADSRVTPAPD